MARHYRTDWILPDKPTDWIQVQVALLMDIRESLEQISGGIRDIKHFFHTLGTERLRVIVQEAGISATKRRHERLTRERWNKKQDKAKP